MSGDVRHIVQSMIRGPNYGIVIRTPSYTEFSTFDEFMVRGRLDPVAAARPRIHITYSIISVGKK
jgi:hypothetical protein